MNVYFTLAVGSAFQGGTAGAWATHNNNRYGTNQTVNVLATTDEDWSITGLQLEVGEIDTPFEFKTYGDELFACQRYFLRDVIAAAGMAWMIGQAESTTLTYGVYSYPTTMRAAPTLGTTGTATDYRLRQSGSNVTCSAVPALTEASTVNNMQITFTVASGLTADAPARMQGLDTAAYLEFSAEL
jgi:hypothetical protein